MRIAVIGGGYVGLVSGTCLAEQGHDVLIVEQCADKVAMINRGVSPIHEEGLDELLSNTIGQQLLATTHLDDAVRVSDLTIIAVGTPFDGDEIDLGQIESASISVGQALRDTNRYHVVVVKSTVVPGTTDDLVTPLLQMHSGKRLGVEFGVGMNPEFLREGNAVSDFMKPDRIVIGGNDDRARKRLAEVYAPFGDTDKVFVNNRTAEMIKYASNSLLATLISFSNEIGNLCAEIEDVDVVDVLSGVKLDKRLSPILESGERVHPQINTYLAAGCGFGGSCFPKDVNALRAYGAQRDIDMPVLDAVMQTNNDQPSKMLALLKKRKINLKQARIAILGLAFKPDTDDVRESAALPLIKYLVGAGATVVCYDPVAIESTKEALGDIDVRYADSTEDALADASVVLLVTSWPEFANVPNILRTKLQQPLVIDGRRMLEPDSVDHYEGIGRGRVTESGESTHGTDQDEQDISSAA